MALGSLDREQVLFLVGIYYFVSTAWIDITSILVARFTSLTFQEFGRPTPAKRFINHGVLVAAAAWTVFLIGAIPVPHTALTDGERLMCFLLGVFLKSISQPLQMVGWFRFWIAMRKTFIQMGTPLTTMIMLIIGWPWPFIKRTA